MQVGFTVVRRPEDIEITLSIPDNNEQNALVTSSRAGDSFALFIGHLYYRQDLLSKLSRLYPHIPLHDAHVNDASLVLTMYRYLGITALERLEGDFALNIWDAENRQLIGLRDPMGGYPLFWIQQHGTVALSTSIRPLCAMLPQCSLNEAYCAEFVMMQASRNEGSTEQCVYKDIHRVLPGTMIIARANVEGVERYAYWDWSRHINDPGTNDLGEIAEAYRGLLLTAVQERFRGRTLAHLSGGMDSTSIALLARTALGSGAGEAPLHVASLVYNKLPLLARERPYIESALRDEPAIIAHRIQADDFLDFDVFADPPLHDEPYTALPSFTTRQPFVDLATEIGASTILTGYGSDETHYLLPYYLADLLRQPGLRKLTDSWKIWQEATRWARAHNCSPWRILMTFAFNPIVLPWVAGTRWACFLTKKDADWSIPTWITPDFARQYALRDRAVENSRQSYQQCQQTSLSIVLSAILSRVGDAFRWSVTAPLGIDHMHPFLDLRLLSFGLGMQSRVAPEPGNMKPVLAEAMRGILPDMIRYRQQKNGFNEVYYLGLARNIQKLEDLIRHAPLDGMIDKKRLVQQLQEGSLAGVPPRHLQRTNHMLSLLKWLSMQEKWIHVDNAAQEIIHVPVSRTVSSS